MSIKSGLTTKRGSQGTGHFERSKCKPGGNGLLFVAPAREGKLFDRSDDTLLTADQLAAKLNVSLKTIRKWRYERTMPPDCMVKVGKHMVRYRWRNVQRWLQLNGDTDEHTPY